MEAKNRVAPMSLTSSGPEHVVQFDQSKLQVPHILNENPTYIP